MRAFIFSLDAFVAFTLALVAIYSLIFFSSIPSSYYYLLTQGHYLARDVLYSVSTSDCDASVFVSCKEDSVLDNIVFGDEGFRNDTIQNSVGMAVPDQFGYILDVSTDNGGHWKEYYDTSKHAADTHAKSKKKLSVSSQVPVFRYSSSVKKDVNPYLYKSCMGDGTDFVITCSDEPLPGVDSGTIVPKIEARLVRLTIYI